MSQIFLLLRLLRLILTHLSQKREKQGEYVEILRLKI